eukprot:symbB.v1.2.029250.t1/scaffold3178.1/size61925/5
MSWITSIYWLLDIPASFLVGYAILEEGTVEMRITKIARKYLRTWFIFDLIIVVRKDVAYITGNGALLGRVGYKELIGNGMPITKGIGAYHDKEWLMTLVEFAFWTMAGQEVKGLPKQDRSDSLSYAADVMWTTSTSWSHNE